MKKMRWAFDDIWGRFFMVGTCGLRIRRRPIIYEYPAHFSPSWHSTLRLIYTQRQLALLQGTGTFCASICVTPSARISCTSHVHGPDTTYSTDLRSTDSDYHNTNTVTDYYNTSFGIRIFHRDFFRGSYHLRHDCESNGILTTLKDSLLYVP